MPTPDSQSRPSADPRGICMQRPVNRPPAGVRVFECNIAHIGFVEGRNLAIEYRWRKIRLIGCRRSPPIWFAARCNRYQQCLDAGAQEGHIDDIDRV
jgi:hypothetical protein